MQLTTNFNMSCQLPTPAGNDAIKLDSTQRFLSLKEHLSLELEKLF